MSGIFGILHRDGRPVAAADLERMRDAMAHRGPDGSRIWYEGTAGLGQLMLQTTPESLYETLPFRDPGTGLVITADARIDNREELRSILREDIPPGPGHPAVPSELSGQDHPPSPVPDSQYILAAYKRWAESCVDYLLGDFAFVIWDPRRKKIFGARDHMGVRPFYYYQSENLFVFASSALAVAAAEAVPRKLSEPRVADYLVMQLEGGDKTSTWFEGVKRMPPAHLASLSGAGLDIREYWRLDPTNELNLAGDEAYTDAYEEVLTQAVLARMRSQGPVASMLSGGVDSSTIVGTARKILGGQSGEPLATFSGVSNEGEHCGESGYSRMVIDQGGLDACLLRPADLWECEPLLKQLEDSIEDPFDMNWTHHQMIYLAARKRGHVAVMDGIDGDGVMSLTTAYPLFLIRQGMLKTANREILGMRKHYYAGSYPPWRDYAVALKPLLIPRFARRWKQKFRNTAYEGMIAESLISKRFADKVRLRARWEAERSINNPASKKTLREAHVSRLEAGFLTAGIERYGRLAAACGVEQREPLLDKRFVEFCVALPWQQKVRNGWSKYGFRLLAQRTLPDAVAWRRGRDQDSILWKYWSARGEIDQGRRHEQLSRSMESLNEYVDNERFLEILKKDKIGVLNAKETLLNLVNLYSWTQRHF